MIAIIVYLVSMIIAVIYFTYKLSILHKSNGVLLKVLDNIFRILYKENLYEQVIMRMAEAGMEVKKL